MPAVRASDVPNGRHRNWEPSALSVRVDNLADDVHGFRVGMESMRTSMATKDDLANIVASINALAAKQETVSRPNWQALSVAVSVIALIGAILYWPIRESTLDLKSMSAVAQTIVARNQVDIGILQEQMRNQERRYDAISNRLAELIRTGK